MPYDFPRYILLKPYADMLGIKPVSSAPAGLAPAGLAQTVARLQILLCSPVTEVACLGELRATPKNRSLR